ncbi:MAG TPA: XdhC family protein [Candidatus Binatia bacterium]|nr:XdhC family protein [Candidatus Binatia bacterium]
MNNRILEKAGAFLAQNVPFALATVVRRERPTSGEPGDKAIITSDGEFLGWIGGSCAQPTVIQEAKKAIADGEPRLVVLTPNLDEEPREGVELYRMTCYSGGTMEIYIEPYLPAPQLLVCGASPAAEALVKIGAALGFNVVLIDPSATKEKFPAAEMVLPQIEPDKLGAVRERYAVVATNGNWDDEAIKALLPLSPDYLGLIASKKRFQQISKDLKDAGVAPEKLDLIKCPAGIDMPARTFSEVALCIIAEIVTLRRSHEKKATAVHGFAEVSESKLAEDPVCHMKVDPVTAAASFPYAGVNYYFCNAHCKSSFEKDPTKYLPADAPG